MYTWIIYDIRKNKIRSKISKLCKQLGLRRVQKSVFLGKTKKSLLKNFKKEAYQLINLRTDVLFIVPMSMEEYRRMIQLGSGFDKKILKGPKTIVFI